MSKRFGRNQKRKFRQSVGTLEQNLAFANTVQLDLEKRLIHVRKEVEAEYEARIIQARKEKNYIKFDVDAFLDEREMSIELRAHFEHMGRNVEPMTAAYRIPSRDLMIKRSDQERADFILVVGREIANYAIGQMMRRWRLR